MPLVTCHRCDAESMAPRELIGLEWDCPKCGQAIDVENGGRDRRVHHTRSRKRTGDGPFWTLTLLFVIVATLFIPLVGIIDGIVAMGSRNERRRAQGLGVLLLGLTMCVLYAVTFVRMR